MEVPQLSYDGNGWRFRLPTIRAHQYTQAQLDLFLQGGSPPLTWDTNLVSRCNTNCVYCATRGGRIEDPRFPTTGTRSLISDAQITDLILQLGESGAHSFFVCSNGEPLLNPSRFLNLARSVSDSGVRLITYTNATTLTPPILRELRELEVSLVLKIESFNSTLNDSIVVNRPGTSRSGPYRYAPLAGELVPSGIIDAFEAYAGATDMLGIESAITSLNSHEVLDIRRWTYEELGVAHFLKHLYPLGYAAKNKAEITLEKDVREDLSSQVVSLDESYGFVYPPLQQTPEQFSFDVRRFINNCRSRKSTPMRMFVHEFGGIYTSGTHSPVPFGLAQGHVVSVLDADGTVNIPRFLAEVYEHLARKPHQGPINEPLFVR